MFEFNHFEAFLLTSLLLNLSPGNDMLFVISRTVSHGIRGGIFSSMGVALGCMVHVLLAAAGLSAILVKYSAAYEIIRYAGAAYLIYLGITSWIKKLPKPEGLMKERSASGGRLLYEGIITDILNPKVALFFLAFLPQFINPQHERIWAQFLLLGILFNVIGTLLFLGMVYLIAKAANNFKNNLAWKHKEKITGAILAGLGLNIALEGRR